QRVPRRRLAGGIHGQQRHADIHGQQRARRGHPAHVLRPRCPAEDGDGARGDPHGPLGRRGRDHQLKRLVLAAALVSLAGSARAEIALLSNGMTLKVTSWRQEGDTTYLTLKDGGEVGAPSVLVQGVVPDEVVDEVLEAPVEPGAGPRDLRALAEAAARKHRLDPALVLAVVSVESAFRPDAVSPKGAQGLMQLMPGTARSLDVADPLDPAANIDGGTRYLGSLVSRYDGDLDKALAAYNAGPGAVDRHNGVPPYKETQGYVKKVKRKYKGNREGS